MGALNNVVLRVAQPRPLRLQLKSFLKAPRYFSTVRTRAKIELKTGISWRERHDAVIRSLIVYLGEREDLKELQGVGKEALENSYTEHNLRIIVKKQMGSCVGDVSIVIEGTEVLADCKNVSKACCLLMGLIYALNLTYPPQLKYTFQKIFLGLDVLVAIWTGLHLYSAFFYSYEYHRIKMSPKVQALHNKLLA